MSLLSPGSRGVFGVEPRPDHLSVPARRAPLSEYGGGRVPWFIGQRAFAVWTSMLASACRPQRGRHYVPARQPDQLLELYAYEGSPFCRIAREALCELELPYRLHNVPRQSPDREAFVALSAKMQVPYLVDPNTETQMFESADIRSYLYETYAIVYARRV